MKKPAKAAVPGPAKPAAAKAKQPGNRPGRGKAAHAKPAAKKPAHVSAKVRQARHATAVKAAKTRAANAKKAKAHPRRQLALGSAVACCSAEALAASLRLSGWPVSDADVLALYWHTARDEHAGASIWATLEAAAEYGLAGVRLRAAIPVGDRFGFPLDLECSCLHDAVPVVSCAEHQPVIRTAPDDHALDRQPSFAGVIPRALLGQGLPCHRASVILGLSLPAPHAVLDTGSEWISWGEEWPAWAFPGAVIEEAWTIRWEGE